MLNGATPNRIREVRQHLKDALAIVGGDEKCADLKAALDDAMGQVNEQYDDMGNTKEREPAQVAERAKPKQDDTPDKDGADTGDAMSKARDELISRLQAA